MSQLFYGSICLTDLIKYAKEQHSSFTKSGNGKIYTNINVWLNDEPDKFGNLMTVQLNATKETRAEQGNPYIGNLKKSEGARPITANDTQDLDLTDDLPF